MATESDESSEYQKQALLDAIAERLEPLLGRNPPPLGAQKDLWGLWTDLEGKLNRDDYPEVSEADARKMARDFLDSAGLVGKEIDRFIDSCRGTGASWRTMCAMAVEWANHTL